MDQQNPSENKESFSMIYYLIYVSSAKSLFDTEGLVKLLAAAKQNNTALGITGMLLYKDGNFMQVIEGEQQQVQMLYEKIKCDPRHNNIIVINEDWIDDRMFPDWKMGFRNLDVLDEDLVNQEGYSDFMNSSRDFYDMKDDKNGSLMLLKLFKDK